MKSRCLIALVASLFALSPAGAQNGQVWQFHWQKGQVLNYRVEHNTSAAETVRGNRAESSSRLKLVKRWEVVNVDAQGVATLNLTITSLRHEQTRPGGEVLVFDSNNPSGGTPELKEQLGKFLGKVVASLRVNNLGNVVEILQGDAKSYASESPFVVVFPAQALRQGLSWQRSFQVTLDSTGDAGKSHTATQTFQATAVADGKATITTRTLFQAMPNNPADRLPLMQKQPQGQVVFDLHSGRMLSARLAIDNTLDNYHLQSQYTEELVP